MILGYKNPDKSKNQWRTTNTQTTFEKLTALEKVDGTLDTVFSSHAILALPRLSGCEQSNDLLDQVIGLVATPGIHGILCCYSQDKIHLYCGVRRVKALT